MKWLLIAALWNTNPPQDSFKFYTEAFDSRESCLLSAKALYLAARDEKIQVQVTCASEVDLKLLDLKNTY